jgi:hypothetical protein
MIKLERFRLPDNEANHFNMSQPWSVGAFTYATNGHLAVRMPRVPEIPERKNVIMIEERLIWDHESLLDYLPLPPYDLEGRQRCSLCTCPECDGEGEVIAETDYNEYEVTCKTCNGGELVPGDEEGVPCRRCNGTGKDFDFAVAWGAGFISAYLLEMIKDLPGVQLSPTGDGMTPWRFIFHGGVGLIMPRKG